MRVSRVHIDEKTGKITPTVTHEPPLSNPAKVDDPRSISTKLLGDKATTSDVLTFLMLMCEQDADNINNPKSWMESSKVLKRIFNGTMNALNAPAIVAEDVQEYEQALKKIKEKKPADSRLIALHKLRKAIEESPQLRGGVVNAAQNLKMKVWAKVYYLSIKKDGHRTSKKAIAAKIREALINAGYPASDEQTKASDGRVPSARTIETKWLALLG